MTENNSLNEWSDGEDDWIFGIKENNTVCEGDSWEWSDPEADDQWRSQPDNLVPLCKFQTIIIIHFFRN